jgi:glycosyltransferase involved in cell wall biosynthesis
MNRASVLLLCRMSPRLNGRARALVDALEESYDVTVVCEEPRRLEPGPVFRKAQLIERRLAFGVRSLLHVAGVIRLVQMAILGLIHARRSRAGVIICADVPYCFTGLLAKKIWGTGFVFDAYEIMWGLGNGWLVSALFKRLERVVLKNCDLWLVPSEDRARIVLQEQGLRLPYTVIPNLPVAGDVCTGDMRRRLREAGVPADRVTILFQGSLLPRRGLAELFQAAQSGRFHLVVQGDGPLRGFAEAHAGADVTLLPPCPNAEAISWLSAVTASFVYYENDCINSAYACSSKFYASMMAGTPVICNDLPVFRAFSEEHGACVILPKLGAEEIVTCVHQVADQVERLRSEAARAGAQLRAYPRVETLRNAMRSVTASRESGIRP